MAIDIFGIEPTKVSRDLRGKITLLYGEYKTGKTSNAVKFPKPLLLATEKGYNALSGVMAQPINKWTDFKKVLKQLKDPKAHEMFETIILDTADILFDLCEKYICTREDVEKIGDIPFGGGYGMLEKEYDEALREIPLMDYGLVMISHSEDKEFTDEAGESYNKIIPTLPKRPRKIVLRMADIIGYSRIVETEEGNKTYLYMRGTPRFEAGSRWKYTPDLIEFNYANLTNALAEAIEKQEKEEGITAVDEHINAYKEEVTLTHEELIDQCNEVIIGLMEKDENNASKIKKTIENHLGKDKKLAETDEDQADIVGLILDDLQDLV